MNSPSIIEALEEKLSEFQKKEIEKLSSEIEGGELSKEKLTKSIKNIIDGNKDISDQIKKYQAENTEDLDQEIGNLTERIIKERNFREKLNIDYENIKEGREKGLDNLRESIDNLKNNEENTRNDLQNFDKDYEAKSPILSKIPIIGAIFKALAKKEIGKRLEAIQKNRIATEKTINTEEKVNRLDTEVFLQKNRSSIINENKQKANKHLNADVLITTKHHTEMIKNGFLNEKPINNLAKGRENIKNFREKSGISFN